MRSPLGNHFYFRCRTSIQSRASHGAVALSTQNRMAKEGIPYIILFLVPAAAFALLGWWVAAFCCLMLAAFMAFFFRDPERECSTDDRLIISPADGRVVAVTKVEPDRQTSPTQISIFLSPMNVHINRAPIAGEIVEVVY